jgi:integrase
MRCAKNGKPSARQLRGDEVRPPRVRYALANAGHDTRRIQDWLGHRSSSTRRATRN